MAGRLSMAAAAAAFSAGLIALLLFTGPSATAGGSADGDDLNPDLLVETPSELVLQKGGGIGKPRAAGDKGKQIYLRFSHTTSNIGAGPMEIYPDLETETCGDKGDRGRVAYQRIYQDVNGNGTFQRGVDGGEFDEREVGCMIFHDIHNHYHFEDFAKYELYRVKSGQLKEVSEKVSFCVADAIRTHPALPGSPEDNFYLFSECDTDQGIHGISIGWADIYGAGTPGQEFDVSDRRPGRYCLVARTDPTNRLTEVTPGGEDNNIQTIQLKLNTKKATKFGTQIEPLDEPCSPPPTAP